MSKHKANGRITNGDRTADAGGAGTAVNSGKSRTSYFREHWWATMIVAFLAVGTAGAALKYLDDDARGRKPSANKGADRHFLDSVNPFMPAPTATPTPQLSKEYIYAGSRLLAVADANANEAPPADLAVWRPDSGGWYVMGPGGSIAASASWGTTGDEPAPGDFDGDGKTDFGIFRPSTGMWYLIYSSTNGTAGFGFGKSGDKPAVGDFDGDGKSDPAVFRASNGTWYWLKSSTGYADMVSEQFGQNGDLIAQADYDGDGKTDYCVFRRGSSGVFYALRSSDGQLQTASMGSAATDQPVSGDYDGDGKADFAILAGNTWTILNSSTTSFATPVAWQNEGDTAVPNDYDGDGKWDIAVWRDSNGDWYIRKSGNAGALRQDHWGQSGDKPVPAFYRR